MLRNSGDRRAAARRWPWPARRSRRSGVRDDRLDVGDRLRELHDLAAHRELSPTFGGARGSGTTRRGSATRSPDSSALLAAKFIAASWTTPYTPPCTMPNGLPASSVGRPRGLGPALAVPLERHARAARAAACRRRRASDPGSAPGRGYRPLPVASMPTAVIVDAVRTPLGRRNGQLAGWHPVDLAAHVLDALVDAQRPRSRRWSTT